MRQAKILRSLTNLVVKSKREIKVTSGSVIFLFGLTINHGICQRTKYLRSLL
jgi:hypothetical protein